ncbi:hypothetical protein Y1Q_0023789 [Alligator mississippiensis]|uniref:Uncharacterized protein n=1 Tax=Alligator mississippiensis TaxID=8496 RepID=A0A151MKD5_ALLMI|nr:hypothetical protein Y1Q_0023789 [Alligator mississippiensis]
MYSAVSSLCQQCRLAGEPAPESHPCLKSDGSLPRQLYGCPKEHLGSFLVTVLVRQVPDFLCIRAMPCDPQLDKTSSHTPGLLYMSMEAAAIHWNSSTSEQTR